MSDQLPLTVDPTIELLQSRVREYEAHIAGHRTAIEIATACKTDLMNIIETLSKRTRARARPRPTPTPGADTEATDRPSLANPPLQFPGLATGLPRVVAESPDGNTIDIELPRDNCA